MTPALIVTLFWSYVFLNRGRRKAFMQALATSLAAGLLLSCIVFVPRTGYHAAARRMHCQNQIKHIALALHNYHDTYKTLPPAYVADEKGKPAHSWRVLILPFLDEARLYEQYRFDEPWNGPHNQQLLNAMPHAYACPSERLRGRLPVGNTSYFAVTGSDTAWPGGTGRLIAAIDDGSTNTALVVEYGGHSIPWLEPRDLTLDEFLRTASQERAFTDSSHFYENFFYEFSSGHNVAVADGSVRFIPLGVSAETWRSFLTISDGHRLEEADLLNAGVHNSRRLKRDNCVRLAIFVFLIALPMPWVRARDRANSPPEPQGSTG